jgi:hypothetical protein
MRRCISARGLDRADAACWFRIQDESVVRARTYHNDRSAVRSRPKWHHVVRRTSQHLLKVGCCKLREPSSQASNLLSTRATRPQRLDRGWAARVLVWLVKAQHVRKRRSGLGDRRQIGSGKREAITEPMADDANLSLSHLQQTHQHTLRHILRSSLAV